MNSVAPQRPDGGSKAGNTLGDVALPDPPDAHHERRATRLTETVRTAGTYPYSAAERAVDDLLLRRRWDPAQMQELM